MPHILLIAHATDDDLPALADLRDDLATAGRCAVAVVIAGTPVGAGTITISADGDLHVATTGLHVSAAAAGLPPDELRSLAELMREARSRADVPTPPASETEPWARNTDASGALIDSEPAAEASQPPLAEAVGGDVAVPSVVVQPRREVTAAIRQRRRQADPHLDADLHAWHNHDPTRPRIAILGPVTVEAPGVEPEQRRRFRANGLEIGLDPNATSGPICYWDVDDIEAGVQSLVGAGAAVEEAAHDVGGGLLVAKLKDGNGNLIGLRQSR
jgi:hypothetical protein